MARLKPRRVLIGRTLYEIDATALRGPYEGGVYRVGRIVDSGVHGRMLKRTGRRKVEGTERLRVLAALRKEEERRSESREPGLRELVRPVYAVRKKENRVEVEIEGTKEDG